MHPNMELTQINSDWSLCQDESRPVKPLRYWNGKRNSVGIIVRWKWHVCIIASQWTLPLFRRTVLQLQTFCGYVTPIYNSQVVLQFHTLSVVLMLWRWHVCMISSKWTLPLFRRTALQLHTFCGYVTRSYNFHVVLQFHRLSWVLMLWKWHVCIIASKWTLPPFRRTVLQLHTFCGYVTPSYNFQVVLQFHRLSGVW